MSKLKELSRCDSNFLKELAKHINVAYRHYGHEHKSTLVKTLSRKLNSESIETVVKMYLLCFDAKEIAQKVKPSGMREIVEALTSHFGSGEYLYEVKVGSRVCDVVLLLDNETIAIEIKSALDKVSYVTEQVAYYKSWANRVYLAYDIHHRQKVEELSLCTQGIGLLEYSKNGIEEKCVATFRFLDAVDFLQFMTYRQLRYVAKRFDVTFDGKKEEIARRLSQKIIHNHAQQLFQDFLRNRSPNQGRVTRLSVGNDQTYPLELFSKEQ